MNHYNGRSFLPVLFLYTAFNWSLLIGSESSEHSPSFVGRFFRSLFGSSQPEKSSSCQECQKNGSGGPIPIQNAHLTPGNGSSSSGGSPTTIHNLMGGSSISGEALAAIEREKTRQLELSNAHDVLTEHERNKSLGAVMIAFQGMLKEQSEKDRQEFYSYLENLLNRHHVKLAEFEKERHTAKIEKARIEQENLPQLLAHDLEKNKLNHQQFTEKMIVIGEGISAFTADKQRMMITTGALSGLILAGYVSKRGTKVVANYASALLMQPSLVSETSRLSLNQVLRHPFMTWQRRHEELPPVVLSGSLQQEVEDYVASIRGCLLDKLPLRHGLFYGPPGTGKTLFAKKIARELGMHYAIVPGANVHQFLRNDGVTQVNRLFDWAERSSKRVVIFFDEVDALVPSRMTDSLSEQSRNIQNTLYARTGTETTRFLMLGATNTPKLLDPAFISRMEVRFNFPLPNQSTRLALFELYFERFVKKMPNLAIEDEAGVKNMFSSVATQIDGFSGRDISQLTRAIGAQAYSNKRVVSAELVTKVIAERLKHNEQLDSYVP